MPERTLYEILQVAPGASDAEIRDVYRTLAWRPAEAAGEDARRDLNDAYSILSNPARRAAYDQELAARTVEYDAAPPPLLPAPPAPEPVYPQGPWPLRLWGRIAESLWYIGRFRYNLVPLSWVIAVCLGGLGGVVISEYNVAARNRAPVPTDLVAVARGQTTPRYITVRGIADYEFGYTSGVQNVNNPADERVTQNWYVIHDGPNVVFFQGGGGQTSGAFTGMLQPFTGDMLSLVQKDSKEPFWAGTTVLTTDYLDVNYKPLHPGWYLAWFAVISFVLLLMIVTMLRRYTIFMPHAWEADATGEGEPSWPLRAEATGTFRPMEGRRWGTFY